MDIPLAAPAFHSARHLGWMLSAVVVAGCTMSVLWVLFTAIWRLFANRKLADEASALYQGASELRPGPAVVAGRVAWTGPRAVRVEIDQRGTERQQKSGWSHTWEETGRRVEAHPFDLVLPDGDRLEVRPPRNVLLVDKLDQEVRHGRTVRTRIAELTPDEHVYVVGELVRGGPADPRAHVGGYRSPPPLKLVLVGPSRGRMLIASEPLNARFERRVRFHGGWLLSSLVALLVLHSGFFGTYHLRMTRGLVVQGTVTGTRQYSTGSGKNRTTYHRIYAVSTDGRRHFQEDARASSMRAARPGHRIAHIVVPGFPSQTQIGDRPTLNAIAAAFAALATIFFTMGFVWRREETRGWYERRRLVEHGHGRL